VPWKGRIREFAADTLERVEGDDIFALLEIAKENSVGNLLVSYARKIGVSKKEVPEKIISNFLSGQWKWYGIPPIVEEGEISEGQRAIIERFCPDDVGFLKLGKGEMVTADMKALQFVLREDSSDDEEEDEEGDE
jgi:hypothetical protein